MNIRYGALAAILILAANTQVLAQSAGSSVSLQYGTVKSAEQVQAKSKHAGGALLGGIAGAVIADGHPGLGAVAGGLIVAASKDTTPARRFCNNILLP